MPFDARVATDQLANEVRTCPEPPDGGWPENAPRKELLRSPAAARVGRLAAAQGLRLFHYEWRHHLDLPADLVPAHDPSLAQAPSWGAGVLPERKYQSFRHDQAIGGYHPGMRAKWTAHELCHALIGFAWHETASPLFLATAGRLSELLPVVLWYHLDEAHLRRCPQHASTGALHRRVCPECEALAGSVVDEVRAEGRLEAGRAWLEAELLAIRETRRQGQPVPHVVGSLDLCSDGIAYAAAHGPRMATPAFRRFIEGFAVEGGGWVRSLDALEARVLDVVDAITEGKPLADLAPSRTHGEARWVLQDLAWRLLMLWHETEGEAADTLSDLIDDLSSACGDTADATLSGSQVEAEAEAAISRALDGYRALHEEWVLPEPDHLFALGHDLLGTHSGRSVDQVSQGVQSALPLTCDLLHDLPDRVADFVAQDHAVRVPLGHRFATWLGSDVHPALAELAHYEAALTHLPVADDEVLGLGPVSADGRYRLARGVRVLRTRHDVVEVARAADFGDLEVRDDDLVDVDGNPIAEADSALALSRAPDGQPQVLNLEPHVADALLGLWNGGTLEGVSDGTVSALAAHGVLRPVRWGA